jgi:hypothetical protein
MRKIKFCFIFLALSLPVYLNAELPKARYILQKEVIKGKAPQCRLYVFDGLKQIRVYLGNYGDIDFESDWVDVKGKFLVAGLGDRLSNKKLFLYDFSKRKVVLGQVLNPKTFVDTAPAEHKIFSDGVFGRVTTGKGEMWFVWDSKNRVTVASPPAFLKGFPKVRFAGKLEQYEVLSLPKFDNGSWTFLLNVR